MEPERKRRIPVFCTRVAVVTSLSGAVINDVKRTLRRRNPMVEVVCVGAKVQGEGAPRRSSWRACVAPPRSHRRPTHPACARRRFLRGPHDLQRRGPGAAVAACPVPVVTGIGHEPDNSICDMVSDRRCSTPTAAAEFVAPEFSELVSALDGREQRLQRVLEGKVARAASACDGLGGRLGRAMDVRLERERRSLDAFATRPCLTSPANIVDRREVELGADRRPLLHRVRARAGSLRRWSSIAWRPGCVRARRRWTAWAMVSSSRPLA